VWESGRMGRGEIKRKEKGNTLAHRLPVGRWSRKQGAWKRSQRAVEVTEKGKKGRPYKPQKSRLSRNKKGTKRGEKRGVT